MHDFYGDLAARLLDAVIVAVVAFIYRLARRVRNLEEEQRASSLALAEQDKKSLAFGKETADTLRRNIKKTVF